MNANDRQIKEQFRLRPSLQAGKERIASVTPEDAAAIVAQIKPVGLRSLLDPVRMMDRSATNPQTRQLLHEVLEKPFNEAGGEYGRNLQKRSDEVLAKMKSWGIGKKESKERITIRNDEAINILHQAQLDLTRGWDADDLSFEIVKHSTFSVNKNDLSRQFRLRPSLQAGKGRMNNPYGSTVANPHGLTYSVESPLIAP